MATATKITPKDFVEALKEWTVLDIQEALKLAEEELGLKPAAAAVAAAPAAAAGAGGGAAEEAAEEQTEFTVNLTAVGDSKINVIKAVREITGLGLKEAKDLVDAAPKAVKENVNKEEADSIAAKLKEAGATAEIK
jgi:large subunit ribosomal protein L7/L12